MLFTPTRASNRPQAAPQRQPARTAPRATPRARAPAPSPTGAASTLRLLSLAESRYEPSPARPHPRHTDDHPQHHRRRRLAPSRGSPPVRCAPTRPPCLPGRARFGQTRQAEFPVSSFGGGLVLSVSSLGGFGFFFGGRRRGASATIRHAHLHVQQLPPRAALPRIITTVRGRSTLARARRRRLAYTSRRVLFHVASSFVKHVLFCPRLLDSSGFEGWIPVDSSGFH